MTLKIKPFERGYDRSTFWSRKEALDTYLKKQASQDIEKKLRLFLFWLMNLM